MNSRTILIVVALLIALATAYVARTMMAPATAPQTAVSQAQPSQAAPVGVRVLVAKDTLPAGLILKAENLSWQIWPGDSLPDTYVVESKGGKIEDYVGGIARQNLSKGDPVTPSRIVKPGEHGFMAAVLTPGMRAVTISVNSVTGTPGFILPGDRIDLILTHSVQMQGADAQQQTSHRVSETVLRDMRVIGINMQTDNPAGTPVSTSSLTFEATPKQAEKIVLLREMGTLTAALRSVAADDQQKLAAGKSAQGEPATTTWDSQVSQAVPAAGNGAGGRLVSVARGNASESLTFRRN